MGWIIGGNRGNKHVTVCYSIQCSKLRYWIFMCTNVCTCTDFILWFLLESISYTNTHTIVGKVDFAEVFPMRNRIWMNLYGNFFPLYSAWFQFFSLDFKSEKWYSKMKCGKQFLEYRRCRFPSSYTTLCFSWVYRCCCNWNSWNIWNCFI